MKHKITLVVGDWSDDGHGKTDVFTVESSLSSKEVERAFKKGVKALGVDITTFCCDYEDNQIEKHVYDKLCKLHPKLSKMSFDGDDDVFKYIGSEEYVEMYLVTVKAGDKTFKWKHANSDKLNIGGYGLFSS